MIDLFMLDGAIASSWPSSCVFTVDGESLFIGKVNIFAERYNGKKVHFTKSAKLTISATGASTIRLNGQTLIYW